MWEKLELVCDQPCPPVLPRAYAHNRLALPSREHHCRMMSHSLTPIYTLTEWYVIHIYSICNIVTARIKKKYRCRSIIDCGRGAISRAVYTGIGVNQFQNNLQVGYISSRCTNIKKQQSSCSGHGGNRNHQ